jgi:hypothetical protein
LCAAPLLKPIGLQESAQRRVGRHVLEIGVGLGERDEIVVVQLRAPALMRGILGEDCLAHGRGHRPLLAGIDAQLAPKNTYRISLLLERPVVPALDRGEAEASMLIGYGMMPRSLGKCRNCRGELALRRRRRQ